MLLLSAAFRFENEKKKKTSTSLRLPISLRRFKDNKPYPWSEEVSDFVIDSQSRNQSIVVKSLSKEDAGVYSCLIENDSYKVIRRSITLKVFGLYTFYVYCTRTCITIIITYIYVFTIWTYVVCTLCIITLGLLSAYLLTYYIP